jgi:WD40 repeat protein
MTMELFSAIDGKLLGRFSDPGGAQMIHAVYAGGGNRKVVATSSLKTGEGEATSAFLLDGDSNRPICEVVVNARITSLAGSSDGSSVAFGASDGKVRVFNAAELRLRHEIRVHDNAVTALAYHPTQPWIATASLDFSVKAWNYQTGELLNHYLGVISEPNDLEFSPSGELLAVVDKGHAVRIWKLSDTRVGEF